MNCGNEIKKNDKGLEIKISIVVQYFTKDIKEKISFFISQYTTAKIYRFPFNFWSFASFKWKNSSSDFSHLMDFMLCQSHSKDFDENALGGMSVVKFQPCIFSCVPFWEKVLIFFYRKSKREKD